MTEENILKVKNALRTAIIGLTALAAPLVSGPAVLAQSYPDKPITLIVPYGPGGSLDTAARLMGEKLVETIGQPVIIENIGGAAGAPVHHGSPGGLPTRSSLTSAQLLERLFDH